MSANDEESLKRLDLPHEGERRKVAVGNPRFSGDELSHQLHQKLAFLRVMAAGMRGQTHANEALAGTLRGIADALDQGQAVRTRLVVINK